MKKLIPALFLSLLFACSNNASKPDNWYMSKWIIDESKTLDQEKDLPESHFNVLKISVGMTSAITYDIQANNIKLYKGDAELKNIPIEVVSLGNDETLLKAQHQDIIVGYDENGEYMKMDGWAGSNGEREEFKLKLYIEKVD
ncbi:hypothetical protein [Kangiella sp.]|uniref:hypothetical protein n=1 Tax=Kangiella sp. TaxID=1920245 RepID=UPI0019976E28|nr:hypothetical protein [Kangiella sp.]MBD3653252.1 hypothetical protein [Kangiella sp.]